MSPTDASIIAIICKFTSMERTEINLLLDKLEDQSNRKIGLALSGLISDAELSENEMSTVIEIRSSNSEKIARLRREEISSRRQGNISPMARNLLNLFDQGKISQNMLLIYGVQGEIPDRHPVIARSLTKTEKSVILRKRMQHRFGDDWEQKIGHFIPPWLRLHKEKTIKPVDWSKDGF